MELEPIHVVTSPASVSTTTVKSNRFQVSAARAAAIYHDNTRTHAERAPWK